VTPNHGQDGRATGAGVLALIERLGNRLPDPTFLFLGATVAVIALSALGAALGWSVQPVRPQLVESGRIALLDAGAPIGPRSLADASGVYWLFANAVRNFVNFPPLGVILVCMLGIGVAESTGLFAAAMRWLGGIVPGAALTPAVLLLSFMSHIGADSGFIVLPPLAAALYGACGRSPVVGAAVAYAGAAGGFSANLLISPSDALMAPLTERGARLLQPGYSVGIACNWYFLAASTVLLTLVGWAVTSRITEPRAGRNAGAECADAPASSLSALERRGLVAALVASAAMLGILAALVLIPGAPLHGAMPAPAPAYGPIPASGESGAGAPAPRWSQAVVPAIFIVFVAGGLAYGIRTGSVRRLNDVSAALTRSMVSMAPVIAMSFFAAQFLECFRYSQLDLMLAHAGGKALVASGLPRPALIVGLIIVVLGINLLVPSMSAKWTALSSVAVPMLMMAGVAPELTQAAYRVGDSVTNPVTPLNAYIIIALAVVQRYRKDAGIGTIISLTAPYALAFFVAWTVLLLAWIGLGLPLGPGAPLWYAPAP
jgi:aminobenzoyl-glutamate transport protein